MCKNKCLTLKTLKVLACGLLMFSGSIWANNLLEIYQEAKQNDPQLQQKIASLAATEELRPQAKSAIMPSISADYSITNTNQKQDYSTPTEVHADNRYGNKGLTVSVKLPLYDYRVFSAMEQAGINISQAEFDLKTAEQDLIVRVVSAYLDVLAAQDSVEFAEAEKRAINRQLEQSQKRHEFGQIAATGVYEVQARYDSSVAQEIMANNMRRNKLEVLREITGQYYEKIQPMGGELILKEPQPNNVEYWTTQAMQQNPQVISMLKIAELAKETINYKKAGHYPSVNLAGSYQQKDEDGYLDGDSSTNSFAISVSIPIYSGGAISSSIREAKNNHTKAMEAVEQTRRSSYRQIKDAFWGISANISRIKALKQARKSSEIALEATEAGYEVGTRTVVDVMNAQTELHRSQRDLKQSNYSYILNHLLLRQAAGIVSLKDLKSIGRQLGG